MNAALSGIGTRLDLSQFECSVAMIAPLLLGQRRYRPESAAHGQPLGALCAPGGLSLRRHRQLVRRQRAN